MKLLMIVLILCTISMSACSNENEIVDNQISSSENLVQTSDDIENEKDSNIEEQPNIKEDEFLEEISPSFKECVLEISEYSDGVSWIKYVSDNGERDAIMDKEGNILVKFSDDTLVYKTDFVNGSAYIQLEIGESYLIDKNGNKLFSPSEKGLELRKTVNSDKYLPYGDGYYCFESRYESFEEAYTIITIIDSKGETLSNTKAEERKYYDTYIGNGVFANSYYLRYGQGYFINVLTGKEFEFDGSQSYASLKPYINFSDGVKAIDLRKQTNLLYTDGTVEVLNLPEWAMSYLTTKGEAQEGKILIYDYLVSAATSANTIKKMGIYDVVSKQFIELEKYLEKMDDEYLKENNKKVVNDRIVLPMRGADGEMYFAVFDSQWNEIISPTIAVRNHTNVSYSCNRLVINTTEGDVVYDEKGDIRFKASDLELDTFQEQYETEEDVYYTASYKDDVLVTKDLRVIDLNGNILFNDINDTMSYEFE